MSDRERLQRKNARIARGGVMAAIQSIQLHIVTGEQSGAGTDGDVYLSICGREFYIDSDDDDFEQGGKHTYVLGEGSNVLYPEHNDPREQQLDTERAADFPVYVRFVPRSRFDNWQLQRADVRFNDGFATEWDTVGTGIVNDPKRGIWLGTHYGQVAFLSPVQAAPRR
jgi:hypothetical protein